MAASKMVKLLYICLLVALLSCMFCRATLTLGSKKAEGTSLDAAKPHELCRTHAVLGDDSQDDMSAM